MANFSQQDIDNNKILATIVIFPVFFVISFFAGTDSEYVKHCAKIGMFLTVCFLAVSLAAWLLTWIPLLGGILGLIFKIIDLILFIIVIVEMVKAASGTA